MEVEVCVDSLQSARVAEKAGADRIELCAVLGLGGITPGPALIEQVVKQVSLPVHVLLRPRAGDFFYREDEFKLILRDIELCRQMGVVGIVTGFLDQQYEVDLQRVARVREASEGLALTFHRAIDWARNPLDTCAALDKLRVDYILSSGQRPNAVAGLPGLLRMNNSLRHTKLIPAGGIRAHNVMIFKNAGFDQVHLAGTRNFINSDPPPFSLNSLELLKDGICNQADYDAIRKLIETVK